MTERTRVADFSGKGFTAGDVQDELVAALNAELKAAGRAERVTAADVSLRSSSAEGATLTVAALLAAGALGFAGGVGSELGGTLVRKAVARVERALRARATLSEEVAEAPADPAPPEIDPGPPPSADPG